MQIIKIDFSRPWVPQTVRAMQGDSGTRFVAFDLYDGGAAYEIPGGASFTVGYQLRGGFEGAYDTITEPGGGTHAAITASGNRLTVELGDVLTVDSNTGFFTVLIKSADGKKLHTWAVPLHVGPASGTAATDPGISALEDLLTASVQKVQESTAAAEHAAKEAQESADRAAASEPAGAAERAENAAQEAQTAQAAAEASKAAAAQSVLDAQAQAQASEKSAGDAALAALAASQSQTTAENSAQRAEAALAGLDIEAIKAAITPPSTVIYFAMSTPPDGWLVCNGAAVSRSAYAALFAAIGTTYGGGDGSTTFALPDLRDRVAWGGTAVGTVKAAGLPNIEGSFRALVKDTAAYESGAIWKASESYGSIEAPGAGELWATEGYSKQFFFSAHNSNGVYGESSTVQPPALVLLPCIKY